MNKNYVIELYRSGLSQQKIADKIGCSQSSISKILRKNNILPSDKKSKYNINYFEKWSHDMAYILGFITADGNVYKTTLSCKISEKDISILEYIKNQIGGGKITKEKLNSIRIRFNSKYLIESLQRYSIKPNKTFDININFEIPNEYIGDYIRGIFDGDGWITIRPGKRKGLSFGICSASKTFIEDVQKLCGGIGKIRCREYKNDPKRKPQYYFENMTNEDAIKFRDLIYKNEGFSLDRKKIIFFSRLV